MIGGIVAAIVFVGDRVLCEMVDRRDVNKRQPCWRSMPLNPRSRCVGIGDDIWWQGKRTLWTPAESRHGQQCRDFDIDLGESWAVAPPTSQTESRP